jgi:hypothetical protein
MTKRQTRPSQMQAKWLRLIAHFPLQVTREHGEKPDFRLSNGTAVPPNTARLLIRNRWVEAERDGLFEQPQTYRVRTPAG